MNVAQVSLDIAMQAKPTWVGTATHTAGTNTLLDPSLARSGETFAGGTLWAPGQSVPTVHKVKSHTTNQIILEAASATAITSYIISTLSFSELLRIMNAALSREREMAAETIIVNGEEESDWYTLSDARDIRRVEFVTVADPYTHIRHHYWREQNDKLYFYHNPPSVEGMLYVWYPKRIPLITTTTATLPASLRLETFINNCLQLFYRMGVQKMGKDAPANYDLINEAKDAGDRMQMHNLTRATTMWDYDPRYRA